MEEVAPEKLVGESKLYVYSGAGTIIIPKRIAQSLPWDNRELIVLTLAEGRLSAASMRPG